MHMRSAYAGKISNHYVVDACPYPIPLSWLSNSEYSVVIAELQVYDEPFNSVLCVRYNSLKHWTLDEFENKSHALVSYFGKSQAARVMERLQDIFNLQSFETSHPLHS